jgi:hypothetical protein
MGPRNCNDYKALRFFLVGVVGLVSLGAAVDVAIAFVVPVVGVAALGISAAFSVVASTTGAATVAEVAAAVADMGVVAIALDAGAAFLESLEWFVITNSAPPSTTVMAVAAMMSPVRLRG